MTQFKRGMVGLPLSHRRRELTRNIFRRTIARHRIAKENNKTANADAFEFEAQLVLANGSMGMQTWNEGELCKAIVEADLTD